METRFLAPVRVRGIQNGRAAIGVFNRSPRAQPVTSKEK
jgi:hypothetical protein